MPALRITRIRTYPVKSFEGNDHDTAVVRPWGLEGDRRWALIDEHGTKVTARKNSALLGLRAETVGENGVRIHDRDGDSVTAAAPTSGTISVEGFRQLDAATPYVGDANQWISDRIGQPATLIWQADPARRPIDPDHGGGPGDTVSLADVAPLHVVSEASLAQLNKWVGAETGLPDPTIDPATVSGSGTVSGPLDIVRFRPNIVIGGDLPFTEDDWTTLRIGGTAYRVTGLCGRCVVPTIDPATLAGGKEPIRTLARHRRWDGLTWFGVRITPVGVTPDQPAAVSIGDEVTPD
ncbi:MAG TPA: MOSC domain-containing protein [Terrimesophilobacter sp.]|nr:MOSC domain-containing protein [Terrimesophilobacter sp.]